MANENWNPNNRGLQDVPTELTAIANSASGIVSVSTKLRSVRKARADYNGKGGSGHATVHVFAKSGNVVDVQFVTHSGDQLANSGKWTDEGVPCRSGYGFSGGTLTVWADGD